MILVVFARPCARLKHIGPNFLFATATRRFPYTYKDKGGKHCSSEQQGNCLVLKDWLRVAEDRFFRVLRIIVDNQLLPNAKLLQRRIWWSGLRLPFERLSGKIIFIAHRMVDLRQQLSNSGFRRNAMRGYATISQFRLPIAVATTAAITSHSNTYFITDFACSSRK